MLAEIWFALFVIIVAGYLILDGFDMGVGMLVIPMGKNDDERRRCSTASARSGTATRSGW
jgi:cytochrome d ubiquinol oxidase subunit II